MTSRRNKYNRPNHIADRLQSTGKRGYHFNPEIASQAAAQIAENSSNSNNFNTENKQIKIKKTMNVSRSIQLTRVPLNENENPIA